MEASEQSPEPQRDKSPELLVQFPHETSVQMGKILTEVITHEVARGERSEERTNGEEDAVERYQKSFMDAALNSPSDQISVIPISRDNANEILEHYKKLKESGKLSPEQSEEYTKQLAIFFGKIEGAEKMNDRKNNDKPETGGAMSWAARLAGKLSKGKGIPYE